MIAHLLPDTLKVWASYDLIPSYPETREGSKIWIRNRVNKTFKQVQSDFFHCLGRASKKQRNEDALKDDNPAFSNVTPRCSKRLKVNHGEETCEPAPITPTSQVSSSDDECFNFDDMVPSPVCHIQLRALCHILSPTECFCLKPKDKLILTLKESSPSFKNVLDSIVEEDLLLHSRIQNGTKFALIPSEQEQGTGIDILAINLLVTAQCKWNTSNLMLSCLNRSGRNPK